VEQEPGVIIEKGDQVGLTPFPSGQHPGTVHDVGLPDVVVVFGLIAAAVRLCLRLSERNPLLLEDAVSSCNDGF
jgi:hypothetical protein